MGGITSSTMNAMDKTEKLLRRLFDYQRFEENERLDKLIQDADGEDGVPLEDSRLDLNAAGEPEIWRSRKREDDNH